MKRTFYTMLMATALALPSGYAAAQLDVGTAVTGQVGVSSPIGATSANSSANDHSNTRARSIFNNDDAESSFNNESSGNIDSSADAGASFYSTNNLDTTAVRNIQQSLNARGYNVGRVDGRWNQSTAAQLRRYENGQSLSQSSNTSLNAETLQHLGVGMNDISPATGAGANISPAARTMGGVQGSSSYND